MVLLFAATLLFFLPSRVGHQVVRFHSQQLVIETSKTSPPRLAFHETVERKISSAWKEETSGKMSSVDLNQLVAKDSPIAGLRAVRYKKLVLSPMQVPRDSALRVLDEQSWMEGLPAEQRKRLEMANERSRLLENDWKLPSWGDLVEEKLQEIGSQTKKKESPAIFVQATDSDGNWITPEEHHNQSRVEVKKPDPKPTDTSVVDKHTVSGLLKVTKDTLWGPGRHFEVRWFEDGVAKETGRVNPDPHKFSYSIEVPNLSGTVIARLVDDQGAEIGTGHYRISASDSPERLKNIEITVAPRSQITRHSQNFYDQDTTRLLSTSRFHRNPSPEAIVTGIGELVKADEDGLIKVEGVAEGSWTFLRTQHPGFYQGLYLASAGDEKPLPLFPEKMMKALLQIVRDSRGSGLGGETGSVIWGQATFGGAGAAGLRVEIEDLPEAKPVYFNDLLIPDEQMTGTTSNGYFAFVDLPKGFYSLRVLRGERQVGVGNIEVDDETVSPLQIATDVLTEKVPVKVFDAFTGTPQLALVEFQHLPEAVEVTGFANIDVPRDDALALVKVTPQGSAYLETTQIFSSSQDYLHLPLIRQDWLASLKGAFKIPDVPGTGVILGFVPGADYELQLPHLASVEEVNIIYFDAQGMPSERGVAGGGFIVFNAPAGSHTVSVLPSTGEVLHSRVLPVDESTVNVLKFDF
jgi:hypothetical protein